MGPRLGGRGNGGPAGDAGLYPGGFNGATSWWTWKHRRTAPPPRARRRFNGATSWWTWKRNLRLLLRLSFPASMGPRLGGRGNGLDPPPMMLRRLRFNGATSWWTWKHAVDRGPRRACRCFNGATSWWTWKPPVNAARYFVEHELQWGHVLVDVETIVFALAFRSPSALQWGHVLVDVETRWELARASRGGAGFNGATSWWTWKRLWERRVEVRLRASMGPRLGGRGNALCGAASPPRGSSFNGATSWWTWKRRACRAGEDR